MAGVALITIIASLAGGAWLFAESLSEQHDHDYTAGHGILSQLGLTGIFIAWLICLAMVIAIRMVDRLALRALFLVTILAICVFYFGRVFWEAFRILNNSIGTVT